MFLRHQPDNLAALTDDDLGIKGKPARQFGPESRPGDWPPDHEGARRADVDGIEVLQLFSQRGRPEGSVAADVDPSQKNHECHASPPAGDTHAVACNRLFDGACEGLKDHESSGRLTIRLAWATSMRTIRSGA